MLAKLIAPSLILVAWASAATAEDMCGDLPIAPALPSATDIQQKSPADAAAAKHGAFMDVKKWQDALKSYRSCLDASVNTDKRDLGEAQRADKPDTKKIEELQQGLIDLQHAYEASVDDEERTVNAFHAVQVAYCGRKDVDHSTCPKN